MYRLVFLSGRNEGKRLIVRQAVTLVGHDADCHLLLPEDHRIAPRHARFEERGSGIYLTALSPDYPVERNGSAIQDTVQLRHDDQIRIGQTLIQFQELIAPHPPARQSPGLLQPVTLVFAGLILLLELALLAFLVNWPKYIIRPETEKRDLAFAERHRAEQERESGTASNAAIKAQAPSAVVTLPGATPEPAPEEDPDSGSSQPANPPLNPSAGAPMPTSAPPAVLEVLQEADFKAADTNQAIVELKPISRTDPRQEDARRILAEARAAAQFSDFAQARRLLNQLHQSLPGYLPAYVEHARLLESRGDLDGAKQRWSQVLGIADTDDPTHALAKRESARLEQILRLQTRPIQTPDFGSVSNMPRHIRIESPNLEKMPPGNSDITEERMLNFTLQRTSQAPLFKKASIQVFITFFDKDTEGRIHPTVAITSPSPLQLGQIFASQDQATVRATYVVPRGLRAQEERENGFPSSYYGYTIHVFAGQILQDSCAKPKKLLEQPLSASDRPQP